MLNYNVWCTSFLNMQILFSAEYFCCSKNFLALYELALEKMVYSSLIYVYIGMFEKTQESVHNRSELKTVVEVLKCHFDENELLMVLKFL